MTNINKFDYINVGGLIATILGVILEIIGMTTTEITTVGVNLSWNALTYVGMGVIVAGLIISVYGYEIKEKKGMNKILASVALYVAEAALVFAILFFALNVLGSILNPANG